MSPEMESMDQFRSPNGVVDASIARSWSVTFAQFVPSALRKKAGRHVPEIGTWIVAKNSAILIIKKRSCNINSVQSDEPAVQEASLSIVVDGILHMVHPLRDLNLALPKSWSPILGGRRVLVGSYRRVVDRTCFKLALRFADSAELKDCFASIKEALADEEDQDCRYAVALFDGNLQAAVDSPPTENSRRADNLEIGAQCTRTPASHSKSQQAVQKNNPDTLGSGSLNKRRKRSFNPTLLPGSGFQALLLQGITEPLVHFPRHRRVTAANAQAPQEYTIGKSELHRDVCLSEVMDPQAPNHNESYMIGEVGCHKETYNLHEDFNHSSIEEQINLQRTDQPVRQSAVQRSHEFEDPLSSLVGSAGLSQSIDFRGQLLDCILDPSFRTLVKEVEYLLLELERSSHTDVIAKLLES